MAKGYIYAYGIEVEEWLFAFSNTYIVMAVEEETGQLRLAVLIFLFLSSNDYLVLVREDLGRDKLSRKC